MDNIFEEIRVERKRQDGKFGRQSHDPFVWTSILSEEVGEVNKAALQVYFNDMDTEEYRQELVHVASVCVAAIQTIDGDMQVDEYPEIKDNTVSDWLEFGVDGKMIEDEDYEVITQSGKQHIGYMGIDGFEFEDVDEDFTDEDDSIIKLFRKRQ